MKCLIKPLCLNSIALLFVQAPHSSPSILVGFAQTAAVFDLLEVVGLLFCPCFCSSQVGDPTRGKHVRWSFSTWPWAADLRKRDIPEAPVAPDKVRPPSASQGSQVRNKIALLMAIAPHRHENLACVGSKRLLKLELEHIQKILLQILVTSSVLKCLFNGYQKCGQN